MKRKLILLLLAFCLAAIFCVPALGASAEELMTQFRLDYGLNEENFSICYYNTVTGEEYRWNDTRFMPAASTFKLPLNLYYYELERDGALAPDTRIGGRPLSDCHYQSLVWSNNDISLDMLYNLGSFRTYKQLMLRYFTMEEADIPSAYYADNNYCTGMMLDTLRYLYERSEEFPQMLDYLKQAQPDAYFKRYVTDYEIAHKYGYFEGAVHDVGIVYAPQPFLLAVYTQNLTDGETVVARICETLSAYTTSQYEAALVPPEAKPASPADRPASPIETPVPSKIPAPEATPETPMPDATPEISPEQAASDNLWWMILVAASIFLIADLLVLFAMKKGASAQFWNRYEKKRDLPRRTRRRKR